MTEGNDMSRDAESFNTYAGNMLRSHDTRLSKIEQQNAEIYDIVQMGKGFFKACKYIGIGLKWLGGIAVAILALIQFIHHFIGGGGPPPGTGTP